jgi:hypothetical protein
MDQDLQQILDYAAENAPDKQMFGKLVLAGQKYMFNPKVAKQLKAYLQKPDNRSPQALGAGVAGITLSVVQQSGVKMDPLVMIFGGLALLSHALQFLRDAGLGMPKEDVAEAAGAFMLQFMDAIGLKQPLINQAAGKVNEALQDPAFAAQAQSAMGGQNGAA